MTQPGRESMLERGAQAERTRLSWNRTALALAVNAALLMHTQNGTIVQHLPAIAMLASALACFIFADVRYRQINAAVRAGGRVTVIGQTRVLALLTALPVLIALAGIIG